MGSWDEKSKNEMKKEAFKFIEFCKDKLKWTVINELTVRV